MKTETCLCEVPVATFDELILLKGLRASLIRKKIRSVDFSRPVNPFLNVRVVDIEAIQQEIEVLQAMGESTREFNTFIQDLLLCQCADLKRIRKNTKQWWKIFEINQILEDSREYLWPTKN